MPWRPFRGVIGIGALKDPALRTALLDLDEWARQVRSETKEVVSVSDPLVVDAMTGTITAAAQTVAIANTHGHGGLGLHVTGTWTGTLAFEASGDGGTIWASVNLARLPSGEAVTSATAGGIFHGFTAAGYSNFRVRASAWTSGTATINLRYVSGSDSRAHAVDAQGGLSTTETRPAVGSLSIYTGSGAAQTIMSSAASRRGGTIFNDSGVVCYVKFGTGASSSSFAFKLVDQGFFVLAPPLYTGVVTALWASGSLYVTAFS